MSTNDNDKWESVRPKIDSIYPSTVNQNWEGIIEIKGTNFRSESFVLIDGLFLQTKFISKNSMEAKVTAKSTSATGKKVVKVHDGDTGDISNEVILVVESDGKMESKVITTDLTPLILKMEAERLSNLFFISDYKITTRGVMPYDSSKVFNYANTFCASGNNCPDSEFDLDCTHFICHCLFASGVKLSEPSERCKSGLGIRVNDLAATFSNSVGKFSNVKKIESHGKTQKGDFCFIPKWFGLRKAHAMLLAETSTSKGAKVFAHTNNRCGERVEFEGAECSYYRIEDAS